MRALKSQDFGDAEDDDKAETEVLQARSANFAKNKKVREHLLKVYKYIVKGFDDQWQRSNDLSDYWDIYNCQLGAKQFYTGNTDIFVPIVKNAIQARKTRFANQIFPLTGRFIECISSDGSGEPHSITALAEHYVRKAQLRRKIPALLANGDVEGQYSCYVSWADHSRHVITKKKVPVGDDLDADVGEEIEDIQEEELKASHPVIEIIADADLLILPMTSDSLLDAIHDGGSVTILRRWTKGRLERLIDQAQIDKKVGDELLDELSSETPSRIDKEKEMVCAAGVKSGQRGKHILIYETWSLVELPEGKRLCRTFFGGKDRILSCMRNPLWCDRLPIISCPVEEIQGSAKGRSLIADVDTMQYYANDIINEAADSSMYALLPIIMTDPEKNPRIGSMVLNLAAVWQTSPNDTQFAKFPPMWNDAFEILSNIKSEIFQTLSVNPAMITAGPEKARPTQAQIANEQQVDMLSTADAVTVVETGVLSELITLFMEMDHQYRDEDISVRAYGDLGIRANMESVPPLQMDQRYIFKWFGVEQARAMQQVQAQIQFTNVLRGIPPQVLPGYRINLAPLLVYAASNIFGPRLAPLIVEDIKSQLEIDPVVEVQLAQQGIETPVHQNDNHALHVKLLVEAMGPSGVDDPTNVIKTQIIKHQMELLEQQAAQQAGGPGGSPGGGPPGGPRLGAVPSQQRPSQQTPGAISQDSLAQGDPSVPPRVKNIMQ